MPVGYRKNVEAAMPGTRQEICDRSGMIECTVLSWIRTMRKDGACHISGWLRTEHTSGRFKAIYTLGAGRDAACRLKPANNATKSQRYRRKISMNEDAAEIRRAKEKARYWEKKARQSGDATVNLLFGRTEIQQQANQ